MKWLTLDWIKQHSRVDGINTCEDDLLEMYGDDSEQTVLNLINRSYEELIDIFGDVPKPLWVAALMLVEVDYTHRSPDAMNNMYAVRYSFDMKVKPYMKLASSPCDIPYQVFIIGSQIKILLEAELPDELKMEDVDFTVTVYNNDQKNVSQTYDKSECLMTTEGDYVVLVDSDDLGVGIYMVKMTFEIPDDDYASGFRKEVVKINPHVRVKG